MVSYCKIRTKRSIVALGSVQRQPGRCCFHHTQRICCDVDAANGRHVPTHMIDSVGCHGCVALYSYSMQVRLVLPIGVNPWLLILVDVAAAGCASSVRCGGGVGVGSAYHFTAVAAAVVLRQITVVALHLPVLVAH